MQSRAEAPSRAVDWNQVPLLLTVSDLRMLFGFSREQAYSTAHLLGRRIGKTKMLVPREKFRAWIEEPEAAKEKAS